MTPILQHNRIAELTIEGFALDLHHAQERITDLEADLLSVQELLSLALQQLHDALEREKRLTWRVRELTEMAPSLRRAA